VNRFQPQPASPRPARTRPRPRAAALALAALTAAAVAAGCTAPAARPPAPVAGGTPASAHQPAASASPTASTAAAPACNPEASSLAPLPGPPQVTPGSFMAKIKARGYLIAGVDANTYHFEYFNPGDGSFEGFDIDMVRAVAQAIFGNPNQVEYKAISDADRETDVNNGSVDIVAHTMTINCARLEVVDFSTVYFDAHQQILVLDGSSVTGAASLAGQKVCATGGSDSMGGIAPFHPKAVLVPYITDCLVELQQGQVAAITSDNSILEGLEAQDPHTKIVGTYLEDEPYGLAIAKTHPDFVRFVNAVLEKERTSGAWQASYIKWVGSPAPQPPPAGYAS
jgi:polar amino acid transport system substrate-binding protein